MAEQDDGAEDVASKVFTFEEARSLLPEVRHLTEEAVTRIDALEDADGGAPERERGEKREAIVASWARTLIGKGLEVKGLWLVDFDNGSGYYCWRYPEPQLQFYHSYEDGFSGRMRIQ